MVYLTFKYIYFYNNLFNPGKNSKIHNKKTKQKSNRNLLNELFILYDKNENIINEYAKEHDITVT